MDEIVLESSRVSLPMARNFELQGTPEMVVAGKYRVTGNGLGSQAEVLKVVDYLVELERKARTK